MKLGAFALILPLGLGLLAAPVPAEAQEAGKVYQIGYLYPSPRPSRPARFSGAFREQLRALGYVEGQNLIIEWRYAGGRFDRLPGLAAELVDLKVDVIVASTTPSALAAKQATRTIPIVFVTVSDPVGDGLVASLARPGGNITGVTNILPELSGKLLELLKEVVPGVSRVAVLWNPNNRGKLHEWKETRAAARVWGMTLQSLEVRGPDDFEPAFSAMTRQRPDALITFADSLTYRFRRQIVDFAATNQLPAIYQLTPYVQAGGLMSYGLDFVEHFRRAAVYVAKVLKGAKPADLPVERPTTFHLAINLKTAKALGLTIPDSLLFQADKVIK